MQSYQYIDNTGNTKTVQAATPELAIQSAPNIGKTSGVRLMSPAVVTSDTARDQVTSQKAKLDQNQTDRERQREQAKLEREQARQRKREQETQDREFSLAEGDTTTNQSQDPYLRSQLEVYEQQRIDIANQANAANERLMQLRANAQDPQTNYLLAQVQQMYDAKRQAQEDQNAQLMRATEVSTIRTGIARLAQARSASIMSAEEDAGLSRLMEIEQNRIQAEIKAIQAYQTGEMDIFRAQMQIFDNAAEQQRQVAKDMYTAVQTSLENARADAKATREAIKFEFDIQEKVADNMANVLLNSGMEIGEEELAQVAAEYGLDPNTLLAKVNEQRIQQNKDMLDIDYKQAQIRNIESTIAERMRKAGESSTGKLSEIVTIFGSQIQSGLDSGQSPSQIAQNIAIWADETGMKFNTSDYSQLVSFLETQTAVGSEDIMNESEPLVDDRPAGEKFGVSLKGGIQTVGQGAGYFMGPLISDLTGNQSSFDTDIRRFLEDMTTGLKSQ